MWPCGRLRGGRRLAVGVGAADEVEEGDADVVVIFDAQDRADPDDEDGVEDQEPAHRGVESPDHFIQGVRVDHDAEAEACDARSDSDHADEAPEEPAAAEEEAADCRGDRDGEVGEDGGDAERGNGNHGGSRG